MTRRAYLYFVLTFLLGVLMGGAGLMMYGWYSGHWHRGFDKQRVIRRMTGDLGLTDAQVQQLTQILDEFGKKYQDLHAKTDPQFAALREERDNRVRQILNPEQLAKFNDMVRRFQERMKRQRPP